MTTDNALRAIGLLETLGGELAEMRGEQRASHEGIERRLTTITADLDMLQSAQHHAGAAIAALPCHDHARRISEMVKAVRNGRVETDVRARIIDGAWRRVVQTFAIVGAIGTLAGALWAMLR